MEPRMTPRNESSRLHFLKFFQFQETLGADKIRYDKYRRRQAEFLKDGKSVRIIIVDAVIKGDDDRIAELAPRLDAVNQLFHADHAVAVLLDKGHVLPEILRADGVLARIGRVDTVIHHDRNNILTGKPEEKSP